MSKAEDLSKQYKEFREQCGIKDPVILNEIEEAYFEGYNQAEKDLELSWQDIVMIDKLLIDLGMMFPCKSTPDYYQEVLKRFKAQKGEVV